MRQAHRVIGGFAFSELADVAAMYVEGIASTAALDHHAKAIASVVEV
jgi:hypothetical protein